VSGASGAKKFPQRTMDLTLPSVAAAFLGGLLVLDGREYFALTGLLLVAAAMLLIFKRGKSLREATMTQALSPSCRGFVVGGAALGAEFALGLDTPVQLTWSER